MARPRIGVTGPDRGGLAAWLMTALALWRAGARPVRLRPGRPVDPATLDGLVIGGGTDIDPLHYGEEPEPDPDSGESGSQRFAPLDWLVGLSLALLRILLARHSAEPYDPGRDEMETGLLRHALYLGLPVLGICRGAQLMNVVLGGSLHQDISHFYAEDTQNVRSLLPRKQVYIEAGSRLGAVLGEGLCRVNALHRQAVKQVGQGVSVCARESNEVVQAIESGEREYFLGVQWHPEYMPQSTRQQQLFRALVASSGQP